MRVQTSPVEVKKGGDGKLVVAEEIAEGHVRWPARKSAVTILTAII